MACAFLVYLLQIDSYIQMLCCVVADLDKY